MARQIPMSRNRLVVLSTVLLGVAIIANALGWLRIPAAAGQLLMPASRPLTQAGQTFGSFLADLGNIGGSANRIQELETANATLQAEVARLKELETENNQLREQLDFPVAENIVTVGADVVSLPPDSTRQRIIINRGAQDGITNGMPVIWAGQLVGKITETTGSSSQVELVSDQNFRVLVKDQTTGTPGIVKGQIGGAVAMERIPQTEAVSEGDVIVTSGQDGEFPAGLVVGEVQSITLDAASIFKTARIKPDYNQRELRVVMVIVSQP